MEKTGLFQNKDIAWQSLCMLNFAVILKMEGDKISGLLQ